MQNPSTFPGAGRPLAQLVLATKQRAKRVERNRGAYMRWLRPQLELHRSPRRLKLLRLGNQWGGKTTAGVKEIDWRCTGKHPYLRTKTPPIEAWIVCASWSQSVAIQQKFWDLCDKDELDPKTVFDPVKGFKGKYPSVRYKNGSIVKFKTTGQGGLQLASATIDVALIDEPTERRVFEELKKRVMRRNGVLIMTLTPINGPTDYLREMAAKGQIADVHYPLSAELLIPIGAELPLRLDDDAGTVMDEQWVRQVREETLEIEAPVIVDGEWETRAGGRVFTRFDPRPVGGTHITDRIPDLDLKICVGIDHGGEEFKQVAVLVGVDLFGEHPKVHVLDEWIGEGDTLPEDDARGILAMLARNGLTWRKEDVNHARGDRPYDAGGAGLRMLRKTNKELMAQLRKQLRLPADVPLVPTIKQAKTGEGGGRGSIRDGCKWLHRAMLRPGHFTIHPRCKRLIEALEKWDFTDSEWKDPLDALRYATWSYAMRGKVRGGGATQYLYVG